MNKKPLLVFSGGMDSSYMLWKALEQGDVYTCYIKATQCQDKIPMELAARKKIIAFFEKKTGNRVISDTIVDLGNAIIAKEVDPTDNWMKNNWNNVIPDHTFGQAPLWQFGMQFAADGTKHSKVCMGIVMGDQISMHLGDLALAWQHTCAFSRYEQLPLEFPLMHKSKDAILRELPLEIIPDLWICELPQPAGDDQPDNVQFVPCERCAACETWAKTVFLWERRNKLNLQEQIQHRLNYLAAPQLEDEVSDVQRKDSHDADGQCPQQSGECRCTETSDCSEESNGTGSGVQTDVLPSDGSTWSGVRDQREVSEHAGVLCGSETVEPASTVL